MVLMGSAAFLPSLQFPRRFGLALSHMRRSYRFIPDLKHSFQWRPDIWLNHFFLEYMVANISKYRRPFSRTYTRHED